MCRVYAWKGNAIRSKVPDFEAFVKVVIEDLAYVGVGSQIMTAGSIVTKSVTPHTVVGGNPAKFICTTDEYLECNLKYNVHIHDKHLNAAEKRKFLLSLPEENYIKK